MANAKELRQNRELTDIIIVLFTVALVVLNFAVYKILSNVSAHEVLFFIAWGALFLKLLVFDRILVKMPLAYYVGKVFDFVMSFVIIFLQGATAVTFLLLLFIVADAALKNGRVGAKISVIFALVVYIEVMIAWAFRHQITSESIVLIAVNLVILIAVSLITNKIAIEKEKRENDIKNQMEELQKYKEESTQWTAEIKCQITDLENKNKKISRNLARYSTLQQINQVVNSTLDIKMLLNLVVDMIIGVIGVKYCTIFLKNNLPDQLSIGSTNIKDAKTLESIREKVALKLLKILEGGQRVLNNNIDMYTYPGAMDRGIESALYVPIVKGGKILGLIIAEHAVEHGMDDDSKKFIEAIASQIGMAIENARLYDEMGTLAVTDGLTRVYNRLFFQDNYSKIFQETKANGQSLCVMMMDIDLFKKFNDNYGHDFGDEVLRSIAQLVKNNLDSNSLIARYGGEEFVVLFKNTTLDHAYKLCEELRKMIESNIVQHNGRATKITVSMGVSEFPHVVSKEYDLLKSADEALYQAKSDGRNCVRKGIAVANGN